METVLNQHFATMMQNFVLMWLKSRLVRNPDTLPGLRKVHTSHPAWPAAPETESSLPEGISLVFTSKVIDF